MAAKNYTPINHLIKKYKKNSLLDRIKGRPKEAEPFFRKKERFEIKEVVEHKAELDDEVKPYVKIKPETIDLSDDLKNMGVETTAAAEFTNYQNIKLPISDEKIIAGLHQPITASIRWFATLMEYLLKQAHLALRVVNGKVVRIIRS